MTIYDISYPNGTVVTATYDAKGLKWLADHHIPYKVSRVRVLPSIGAIITKPTVKPSIPDSAFVNTTNTNLVNLGKAAKDASKAINKESENREKSDLAFRDRLNEVNTRLSKQVTDLGNSLKEKGDAGQIGGLGGIFGGISLPLLAVAGVLVFIMVIKK